MCLLQSTINILFIYLISSILYRLSSINLCYVFYLTIKYYLLYIVYYPSSTICLPAIYHLSSTYVSSIYLFTDSMTLYHSFCYLLFQLSNLESVCPNEQLLLILSVVYCFPPLSFHYSLNVSICYKSIV